MYMYQSFYKNNSYIIPNVLLSYPYHTVIISSTNMYKIAKLVTTTRKTTWWPYNKTVNKYMGAMLYHNHVSKSCQYIFF